MVVKLERGERKKEEDRVLSLAKAGFKSKRKMLISNLSTGLGIKRERLRQSFLETNLKESVRAEELVLDDWLKLANLLS